MSPVLVGLVGYYPFVRAYPLGPVFLERLCRSPWPQFATVREMNWGPVAIVQELQAQTEPPARMVLVSAVDRDRPEGSVHCRRWAGGQLSTAELQERMFEAVTGVVHLDNLLAIGAHFGVWPEDTVTVELQLRHAHVGEYVLEELGGQQRLRHPVGELPPSPAVAAMIEALANRTRAAVAGRFDAISEPQPLGAEELTPVSAFCEHASPGIPRISPL